MATLCARAFFKQNPKGFSELMCVRKRFGNSGAVAHGLAQLGSLCCQITCADRPWLFGNAEQTLCTEH